jgi:hypothetical protein
VDDTLTKTCNRGNPLAMSHSICSFVVIAVSFSFSFVRPQHVSLAGLATEIPRSAAGALVAKPV